MDEFAKLREFSSIMETLLGPGMRQGSPFRILPRHRGDTTIPQVYDASNRYDSSLLRQIFLKTYEEQQAFENDKPKVKTMQTMRPAIEHGIAPNSLEVLKPVCVSDVIKKVNHIHTSCVMLVEVIHAPYRLAGTMALVSDSNNDIMMLALYNYVAPEENPKVLFPVGKKFALLCPFLKNARDDPRLHLMLRCDNPQFVVSYDDDRYIWKKDSPAPQSNPFELRQMGNQHFQGGNLKEACKCYSKALMHSEIDSEAFSSDKVSCLSNRAEVNLRLERWHEATKDAQDVLKIEADHTKAKFRLAKALSRTGNASNALVLLEQLQRSGPAGWSRDVDELTKDCRKIANEEHGEYDINNMMKEASTKKPGERISFHGTFVSSKVAIGVPVILSSGKSYRGCKALSDLKEGELVMSSKAFALGRRLSEGISSEVNSYERSAANNARMEMVSQIVRKLWKAPSLGKEVYSLSDGDPSRPPMNENVDKIDVARIRDIVRNNSFNQGTYDQGIRQTWKRLVTASHDFIGDPHSGEHGAADGVWINESMLNHSCTPNCTWSCIADQIFIHTTKPVQKGEELCIAYFPTNGGYENRADVFSRWIKPGVGFECVCDHCDLLRTRDDLRQLAHEVHEAMLEVEEVAKDVAKWDGATRATVAQDIFSFSRRQAILGAFSHLPLRLQHTVVAELHELEAKVLAADGDLLGALKANQLAANINYEVRGSGDGFTYFAETWRIAGLAMACKKFDLARESLEKIWNSPAFQAYPKEEAEVMFQDLTHRYATQQIPFNPQYIIQIQKLVYTVLKGIR